MKKMIVIAVTMLMTVLMVGCSAGSGDEIPEVNANEAAAGAPEEGGERPEGGPGSGEMPSGGPGGMEEASVVPVTVTEVSHETMKESLVTSGKVMPYNEVTVGSDSMETIETLMVGVGDQVEEGDMLYTFDLEATELSSKSQLISASQTIQTVELNLENARLDYEDTLLLYEKDYATESELTSAEQVVKGLELSYEQAVTDYNTIKEQTDYSLKDAVYYSPVTGTIAEMSAVENQISSTGDFTIIDNNYYLIETVVSGASIMDLAVGDEVTVTYGEHILTGSIDEIGVIGINDTDSYDVNVLVPNEADVLRFGFTVEVQFTVKELADQVVLPKKAILTDAYGDYVYIAADGIAEKVSVEQGLTQDGYVQVFGDLKDGDGVIIEGQYLVTEGGSVLLPGETMEQPEDGLAPEGDQPEGGMRPEGSERPEGEQPAGERPEGEQPDGASENDG